MWLKAIVSKNQLMTIIAIVLVMWLPGTTAMAQYFWTVDSFALFTAGENGYDTYRIPALVQSDESTLLAFCEGRKKGSSDSGDIDIVMKRSTDYGKTWSDQ